MDALFNPVNRKKGGIKWGLAAHTVAMFSFLTVDICINFAYQSYGYINCEFPGDELAVDGPCEGRYGPFATPLAIICEIMFYLNMWLADGLLVSSVLDPVSPVSYASRVSSSIDAISFIL